MSIDVKSIQVAFNKAVTIALALHSRCKWTIVDDVKSI